MYFRSGRETILQQLSQTPSLTLIEISYKQAHMDITDKQSVFDSIRATKDDAKALWGLASSIASQCAKLKAHSINADDIDGSSESGLGSLFDDPKRARGWWLRNLQAMVEQGNQQAAKTLQDALGIVTAENDVNITCIDYSNALINCPSCGCNVHQPVIAEPDQPADIES